MTRRNRIENHALMMRIGFVSLVAANLARWLLPRTALFSENASDAVTGYFYGVAIATLLAGLYLRGRATTGGNSCA